MKDWKKYKAVEVLNEKDENGNRLLSEFARDYKSLFNSEICPNCNDFSLKFQKFIKTIQEMKNKNQNSGYVLKKMYENIPLEFGSSIYVNNANLTDEYAETLLKKHPRGKDLFDVIVEKQSADNDLPEDVQKLIDDNTKDQLLEIAKGLSIEDFKGNKTELATLIVEKQSADK
jgi:hypothetical protein